MPIYLKALLLTLIALLLPGCAAITTPVDDDYQFGATTGTTLDTLFTAQDHYCAASSPARRAILLAVIRRQVPDYPASGLCTDPLSLVEHVDTSGVDVEQAMRDREAARERAQEYGDESTITE